ncbi:MAG: hypothetical protein AAF802_26090 [Planctomycetota bacterium]
MTRDSFRSAGAIIGLIIGLLIMRWFGQSGVLAGGLFGAGGALLGGIAGERMHALIVGKQS